MPFIEVPDDLDISTIQGAKPYDPPDVDGLKSHANKILSEKKALEAKVAESNAELARLQADFKKGKVGGGDGDIQSKLDDAMAKLTQYEQENQNIRKQNEQILLKAEASKLVSSMKPLNEKAAEILTREAMGRLALDNGAITVLNSEGKPTVSKVGELQAELSKAYDFLITGSQAAGGGAPGSRGGAAGAGKTISRSDFDAMSQQQRSEFAKSGGKVTND